MSNNKDNYKYRRGSRTAPEFAVDLQYSESKEKRIMDLWRHAHNDHSPGQLMMANLPIQIVSFKSLHESQTAVVDPSDNYEDIGDFSVEYEWSYGKKYVQPILEVKCQHYPTNQHTFRLKEDNVKSLIKKQWPILVGINTDHIITFDDRNEHVLATFLFTSDLYVIRNTIEPTVHPAYDEKPSHLCNMDLYPHFNLMTLEPHNNYMFFLNKMLNFYKKQ